MRIHVTARNVVSWSAPCFLAALIAGCGGSGVTPVSGANPAAMQSFARTNYVREQIAAGNFIEACPALTFHQARCMALGLRNQALAPTAETRDSSSIKGYGATQLEAAYELTADAKNDTGGTVAIVDAYGYPTLEKDLAVYRKAFGLPKCSSASGCLTIVNQNGQTSPLPSPPPPSDVGWLGEQAIDVDMASANCPNCHIIMVEASSNLYTAEHAAARMHPDAISNSWGGPEYKGERRAAVRVFYHPDIAITASSGDGGYGVIFPSAAGTVTAIGGTSLHTATNPRGYTETAWSGAGSGCSAYIPVPTWQQAIEEALGGCKNRIVSDVSYVANPYTGVAAYESYENDEEPPGWQVWGGTSVGSPAIAAIYALSHNTYGIPAAIAYGEKRHLHDVTTGSNGSCSPAYLCTAEKGYDGPTGLGTPNGVKAF
ncbi:MAG: peptidase S8 [Candidatus Eremiobacteraeota bacterium]|nr:peptidase S8 [Candidatus Eremiobacteraeota bacterium]